MREEEKPVVAVLPFTVQLSGMGRNPDVADAGGCWRDAGGESLWKV